MGRHPAHPAPARASEVRAEEAAEELRHVIVAHRAAGDLAVVADDGGVDVDHARADLFDQIGEVGQAADQRLRRCPRCCSWRRLVCAAGAGPVRRPPGEGSGQQTHGLRAESGSHRTATSGSDGREYGPAGGGREARLSRAGAAAPAGRPAGAARTDRTPRRRHGPEAGIECATGGGRQAGARPRPGLQSAHLAERQVAAGVGRHGRGQRRRSCGDGPLRASSRWAARAACWVRVALARRAS